MKRSAPILLSERRKLWPPDEGDTGWRISEYDCWRPGCYGTEETARHAFAFCDDVLRRLQDAVAPENVTLDQLLAEANPVCDRCLRAITHRKEAKP